MNRNSGYAIVVAMILLVGGPSAVFAESELDHEMRLLAEALEVGEGAVIADIGAGDGEHAIALSGFVGDSGTVYATELEEDDREAIKENVEEEGANRVMVLPAEFEATGLPGQCCDGAYLRGVYHHLTNPEAFNEGLFQTIRPGGRLVIIDFPPTAWLWLFTDQYIIDARGGHGIHHDELVAELEAAGFVRRDSNMDWPGHNFVTRKYAVTFDRP